MGSKTNQPRGCGKAGVPPVPGTHRPLAGAREVVDFGDAYGWPVAVKAAFGGGGRGCASSLAAEALALLESAEREAEAAFGRSDCYVERYLSWPRHVEVQVIADCTATWSTSGPETARYRGATRSWSKKPQHRAYPQKWLPPCAKAAIRVVRACGYQNAGTVELIYQDGEFYFLEMNTRLQVEHPVTEMVTGLDLVSLQFDVASGQPLPFSQRESQLTRAMRSKRELTPRTQPAASLSLLLGQ